MLSIPHVSYRMASTMMGEERTPTTGVTTGNYGISHYSVTNGNTADEPIEKQQGFVGNKIEFPEIVKDEGKCLDLLTFKQRNTLYVTHVL